MVDGLTLNNSTGLTLNGNLTVTQILSLTNGAFTIGANTLSLNGALTPVSGTLAGGPTSNLAFGGSASTSLPSITLNNLTLNRSGGIVLGGDVYVGGTLALTSGKLTVGGNTLTISGGSPGSGGGTVDASNASANLVFANASAITLPATFFTNSVNNLTLRGTGGVTAGSDFTVNGVLDLAAANPSATRGILEMTWSYTNYPGTTATDYLHSYVLNMGLSATTTGIGDVTGTVKRSGIVANTAYTYGNKYTSVTLTTGTMPDALSVSITLGTTPANNPNAIKRTYEIIPTVPGGYISASHVIANLHYLDTELTSSVNGHVNTETSLVTTDGDIGIDVDPADEHGRAAYDFTNNYCGLSNIPIDYFIKLPSHDWRTVFSLRDYEVNYKTWTGASSSSWDTESNWNPTGAPDFGNFVIIPDAASTPHDPELREGIIINTLTIQNGGVLVMGSNTLTIQNSLSGGWEDQNSLGNDPGTSKVVFSRSGSTVSGNARFYNVEIADGADMTNGENSSMKIGNAMTKSGSGTGKWYADLFGATIEYDGGSQSVIAANGFPTYHNLILSGSGVKTMPASALTLHGNLTVTGTASATAAGTMTIAGDITINAAAVLGTGTESITAGGDINCDGTITSGSGSTLIMNSTLAQSISGSAGTGIAFYNLSVTNTSAGGVFINKNITANNNLAIASGSRLTISPSIAVTVTGTLSNSSGTDGLVLLSDASGTASLMHNTNNVNATIERYISGTSDLLARHYHLVSVPLSSATYQSMVWINSYLFTYNEIDNSWKAWDSPTTNTLQTKEGAMIYYPDDSRIYSMTGMLNNGTYRPTVTYSGSGTGYNLVPNPYPSAIDWNAAAGWTKTNMSGTIWGFDPVSRNYGAWTGSVSTNNVTRYIPFGQSFFVNAISGSPELDMTNAVRLHSAKAFMKTALPDVLHIIASANAGQDEIAIQFTADATKAANDAFDAVKFYSSLNVPQLSSFTPEDATLLSISGLPYAQGTIVIPLRFEMNYSGQVEFTASGLESFANGQSIKLEDRLLNEMTDLNANPVYTFIHQPGDDLNRFRLHVSGVTGIPEPETALHSHVYLAGNELYISSEAGMERPVKVTIYTLLGQPIDSYSLSGSGDDHHLLQAIPGVYLVRLGTAKRAETHRIVVL